MTNLSDKIEIIIVKLREIMQEMIIDKRAIEELRREKEELEGTIKKLESELAELNVDSWHN